MPKVVSNLKVLESETEDVNAKVHAVVSSVIIAYVFTKYNVALEFERNDVLLKCLRLPAQKEVCFKFLESINKFDEHSLR